MDNIAIVGGSGFSDFKKQGVAFINRHGLNNQLPPHKINHKKNILLLKEKNIKTIIGICSVGSLKTNIKPGSIIIPDDYINLTNIQTYFDTEAKHITPSLDKDLREKIINAAKKINLNIIKNGIYFQTTGPKLETKAEINMIKHFADIVGMTMANEATLAKELNIQYAAICSVDNYANGINKMQLTNKAIKKAQNKSRETIIKLLEAIL